MKLLSINISLEKEISHNGKIIRTGIFKKPVNHRVFVDKTNLEGDSQSDLLNHGGEDKAVYAFASDRYEHWRALLSQSDLNNGAFGENLTISSLDESELCIGDKLVLGDLILEVSQPRVPCFKLGIALNNKDAPYLFTKSFSTGIYFRVKQEGFIEAGCDITVIKNISNAVSVQSLFRAYFDKSYADSKLVLEQARKLETLSAEWQEKVIRKLSRSQ